MFKILQYVRISRQKTFSENFGARRIFKKKNKNDYSVSSVNNVNNVFHNVPVTSLLLDILRDS